MRRRLSRRQRSAQAPLRPSHVVIPFARITPTSPQRPPVNPRLTWGCSTAHLPQPHPGPEQRGNLAPGGFWRPLRPWVSLHPLRPLSALYPQPNPSSASAPASQLTLLSVTLNEPRSFGISAFCSVLNHVQTLPFPWVFRMSAPFLCSVASFVGPFLPWPLHLGKKPPTPRGAWPSPPLVLVEPL